MCSDVQSHESSYPADLDLAWDLSLTALWLLHRAADYAGNAGRSPWDFAIGVQQLRAAGFSDGDLRWLCCKGYAEHAFDTSRPGGQQRTFEHAATLAFDGRSSFVLTTSGIQLVRQLEVERDSLQLPSGKIPDKVARCDPDATPGTPHWDVLLRDLWVGQALVKHFSVPAPNQERILAAFQEESWPTRIDDPLPPVRGITPKRRLHSTIQCLNRNQKTHLLQFHGDGCGCGIRWELVSGTYGW